MDHLINAVARMLGLQVDWLAPRVPYCICSLSCKRLPRSSPFYLHMMAGESTDLSGMVENAPIDLSLFTFSRVLNEDPHAKTITILGTYPSSSYDSSAPSDHIADAPGPSNGIHAPAILIVNKTHFDASSIEEYVKSDIGEVKVLGVNDIYNWLLGWTKSNSEGPRGADVKMTLIRDATEVHIRKYSRQKMIMVHETPALYRTVVLPWVDAIPPERIQWVHNILEGKTSETILSSTSTHVLLPDLKWDQSTISSLYLVAIIRDHSLRSIRDLRKRHVSMLKEVRADARRIAKEKWGVDSGQLRMYFHYAPSYYHLHVHVTALSLSMGGMSVGQAHLLDDVISLLELEPDDGPGIMERRTLSYVLGEQHALYDGMTKAQATLEVS
ncbi:scavenger mRNA decapping enzyme [Calocera viscosa TUFC12733]|uniref:Scavenger mRNA decapping enzyme n=1 Tax=Calocera viscosa (strain TUFC12733) TaxID=1330018 RepID=A0A167KNX4_CALVF|nr:scavenger mRNA decapping enzyme [Calocera viscosa TUFC12733]